MFLIGNSYRYQKQEIYHEIYDTIQYLKTDRSFPSSFFDYNDILLDYLDLNVTFKIDNT